jgi:hypothetical protein
VHRHFSLWVWLLSVPTVLSCAEEHFPGSEVMGTFAFTATAPPLDGTCTFAEMPTADFAFTGTFSRNPDGETFFTLAETDRAATFDGQLATSSQSAPRVFQDCNCATGTQVNETITVALLSRSQTDAVGGNCPPNPLDGGVPPPGGGITGPGSTGTSFDAILACGELNDEVEVTSSGCTCGPCFDRYQVEGVRQ